MVLLQNRKFHQIGSNLVSTCSSRPNYENEYLQLMFLTINKEVIGSGKWPHHASCWTSPDVNEPDAHRRCASDERLIFSTITHCYDKRVTVFAVAIVVGDMEVLYGKFTWDIIINIGNLRFITILDNFLSFTKSGRPISTLFLPFLGQKCAQTKMQ